MAAKAQKAADIVEIKIGPLRDKLRDSSDREKEILATARKHIKDLQDKSDVKHPRTTK